MSVIRVVHTLNTLHPSGAERMLQCSYSGWREMGIEPIIVALSDEEHSFAAALESAGYPVHRIPDLKTRQGASALLSLLRDARPDVVHIHAERRFALLVAVAKIAGVRAIVRTVHSHFPQVGSRRLLRPALVAMSKTLGARWVAVG